MTASPSPIWRPLRHHWRMNLAVLAGAAVATAVLTGALVVGDSVRGSLRAITLERLGGIDRALVAQRFFRTELATEIETAIERTVDAGGGGSVAVAPAILLRAAVRHAGSGSRASQVGLHGVDARFLDLFGPGATAAAALLDGAEGRPGAPPAVINAGLARALAAEPGDQILVYLKRWSEVPRGSLLGRKDTGDVVETLRLTVAGVLPADEAAASVGTFGLAAHQAAPLNAFVPLDALQRALDQEGTVNALLLREDAATRDESTLDETLEPAVRASLTLADFGLELRTVAGPTPFLQLESEELVLRPAVVEAARRASDPLGGGAIAASQPLLGYLANEIRFGDRSVPYSTVAAIDPAAAPGLPQLRLLDGTPAPALGEGEVVIDAWTAEDLGPIAVGDTVTMRYFEVGPREELRETERELVVRGIAALDGLGADTELVQDYPGIADSENMSDWDPPFPVDLGRIRDRDEDYWDRYRDAPKAFAGLAAGRALWQTRWGDTTAIRFAAGMDDGHALEAALRDALPLEPFGFAFQPVKADGLAASAGATDFAGLFAGFSLFLIVSAALLAALLFRLGVEQRAGEVGLSLALGYRVRTVKRRLLAEGAILAGAGAVVGALGAVAYAAVMLHLLRTRWLPAVGTTELRLFVEPATLALGAAISVLVVLATIAFTVRRIVKVPATALLRGVSEPARPAGVARGRWARRIAAISFAVAFALLAFAFATGRSRDAGLFFAIGPLLLIGGLAALSLLGAGRSGAGAPTRPGLSALLRMAASNSGRNRGRSMLSTGLVATACFMIVTVAAFQHDYSRETLDRTSGAGGFSLIAEADVPLLYDPSDPAGRAELGLDDAEAPALGRATVIPCRLRPGDDTSCLNLYRPSEPRLLGVPEAMIARGGFRFTAVLETGEASVDEAAEANPWRLLEHRFADGAVPAIGDANSMQYILKLPLGEDLVLADDSGAPLRLRLVATLATSVFQSEMLIAEDAFVRHFPSEEGFDYFLIETPPSSNTDVAEVSRALEAGLAPYGLDAVAAADKLAAFHAVQNTYLSTFRSLGGLGLLLGTVGLAIVLLRNVLERRGELAVMRAFGYRRASLTTLVLAENALLLAGGLALGTAAALVTVSPHLASEGAQVPWAAIFATLGTILLVGLAVCAAAASGAARIPLLPALKSEA